MTMTRGALTSIVFSKVLTVSASVAEAKGANTLTLITIDVENIGKPLLSIILKQRGRFQY
jgi:hypothetical protein